ncbi:MAG: hypothetical protein CL941_09230 [Desulfobacter sp.]|nr:hypothetical protein [Desulfobacter sp.]
MRFVKQPFYSRHSDPRHRDTKNKSNRVFILLQCTKSKKSSAFVANRFLIFIDKDLFSKIIHKIK